MIEAAGRCLYFGKEEILFILWPQKSILAFILVNIFLIDCLNMRQLRGIIRIYHDEELPHKRIQDIVKWKEGQL